MVGAMGAKAGVVAVAVTVAVHVLAALFREGVLFVGPPIAVVVGASGGAAFGRGTGLARAGITVGSGCFVAVTVAIAVEPVRGIRRPKVKVVACTVAVAVDTAEFTQRRGACFVGTSVGLRAVGVVSKAVPVNVAPLRCLLSKGIVVIGS